MSFASLQFLVFFPTVVVLYFLLRQRFRWILLLAASYAFYMSWKPAYVLLIFAATVITFFGGKWIGRTTEKKKRKVILWLTSILSLGILFFYKYIGFVNEMVFSVLQQFGFSWQAPSFSILLPVGISFFIFQSLSYTIDVYRNRRDAEHHFGIFALYVSFFPQLVAGPIEQSTTLLPQFRKKVQFDYERVVSGLLLMTWGFFQKVVVADGLAVFVDRVYADVTYFTGLTLVITLVLFAFQIFADFSGYSDIAIGAARIMGFTLMKNFDRPYAAKTVQEFWQRWHISLSEWFKDYLFTPLALAKRHWGRKGFIYATFITFVIIGVWHGAGWTFVLFGALHGLAVALDMALQRPRQNIEKRLPQSVWSAVSIGYVFTFWCLSLVFFRAQSIGDAWYILTHVFEQTKHGMLHAITSVFVNMEYEFAVVMVATCIFMVVHMLEKRKEIVPMVRELSKTKRWIIYICVVLYILLFATYGATEFIYFQF